MQFDNNLILSTMTVDQTIRESCFPSHQAHFIQVTRSAESGIFKLVSISNIDKFCETMRTTVRKHRNKTIVVCPEEQSPEANLEVGYLLGAYLVLHCDVSVEDVLNKLKDLALCLEGDKEASLLRGRQTATIFGDGLRSLARSRELCWLGPDEDDREFDVPTCAHYAAECNGGVVTLVPGKLLLCPAPAPHLPEHLSWADEDGGGRAGVRRVFGAGYLAAVLADLGVSGVACLGDLSAAAAAAFEHEGLQVRRLSCLDAVDSASSSSNLDIEVIADGH